MSEVRDQNGLGIKIWWIKCDYMVSCRWQQGGWKDVISLPQKIEAKVFAIEESCELWSQETNYFWDSEQVACSRTKNSYEDGWQY